MYKPVRYLLFGITLISVIGGLALLFFTWLFLGLQAFAVQGVPGIVVVALLKVFGVFALMVAYLSYVAARDPVRYVAIINSLAFLLIAAAAIDLYMLLVYRASPFYPSQLVIARSAIRLILALLLLLWRPRAAISA